MPTRLKLALNNIFDGNGITGLRMPAVRRTAQMVVPVWLALDEPMTLLETALRQPGSRASFQQISDAGINLACHRFVRM